MAVRRAKKRGRSPVKSSAGLLKRLRQAERRLRELEQRHELVMGAINEGVYDWNVADDSIYYSESVQKAVGLTPELLKTTSDWRNRIHPEDLPRFLAAFVDHFKGRTKRYECDYRYRTLDGSWRWARTHGVAIRNGKGRAVRMVGSTGDITQLRRTEEALQQSHGRYDLAMRAINEGVYEWDIVNGTAYFSERVYEVLNLTPADFKGPADWRGRIHLEDLPRYDAALVAHFKGERDRFECDYRYRAKDGSWRWARQHGVAVRDPQGRAVRMTGSAGDITDLKQAEGALRKSEERYALATAAAVEGIYEWDIAAGKLFLTERAKAFFSFPAEELTPAAWNIRIHAEDYPRYQAAIVEHFKGRTPQLEVEYRIADASGGYKWVLDRGKAVRNAEGRATKMVGALSDITQRKRAEIELRRARDEATEALEQQTAVSDILRVISSSPEDLRPVFDSILSHAIRLCDGVNAVLWQYDGDKLRFAAENNCSPQGIAHHKANPLTLGAYNPTPQAAMERRTIHVLDVFANPGYQPLIPAGTSTAPHAPTVLAVPLLRDNELLGVMSIWRHEKRLFTGKQVAMVNTFAAQAVIAIENVRLFNETKEALDQQTATGDILRVMSGSPSDVQPVFEAIVRSGVRLFAGAAVAVTRPQNGQVQLMAIAERDPVRAQKWRERFPFPLTRNYMHGAAILDCRVVDMPDVLTMDSQFDAGKRNFAPSGYRAMTVVPMVKDGAAIGAISVIREAPGPLSGKQIALLKTFADQAVIAIENVRLFNETKEALEQLTASSEVLKAISSSIADTSPVFDKILDSCEQLFAGHLVGLTLVEVDGMVHLCAYKGPHGDEMARIYPMAVSRDSGTGCAILDREVVHFVDVDQSPSTPAQVRKGAQVIGFKSIIFAPLLFEGRGIGAIWVGRRFAGPFSAKQVSLLKTFADQAVIAIQNARLFREIHEKSRQLEIANQHKSEFLANMSHELRTPLNAIIGFTRIVMRRSREQLEPKQYENLEKILASGEHLLALINAILDLSKVEAGHVEVKAAEVRLAPVLEQCMKTVEPLVKADAVSLLKEFDGELPQVYADEEKLRQIVINLLSNAVKFTERGTVRVQAKRNGDSFAVAVADTGIGIAADKLDLIFEEFEQADARSTRVYGGTGLGLAIARRLARLMGGDIAVQSTLGSGSTFTLTLPLRYQAQA